MPPTKKCVRKFGIWYSPIGEFRWKKWAGIRPKVCSIFSDDGKFCYAYGLRQLMRDVESYVRTQNVRGDVTYASPKTPNDVRRRSLHDVKCQK